jgi:trk system potassium uptake protein TrkH
VAGWALAAATVPAVVSLAVEHGFYEPPAPWLTTELLHTFQFAVVGIFVLNRLVRLIASRERAHEIKTHLLDYGLILLAALVLFEAMNISGASVLRVGTFYIATVQLLILGRLGAQLFRLNLELAERRIHPARLMVGSFLAVILIGAALLALPRATRPILWGDAPHHAAGHLLNCLFTATSATCVTGLVVYDTGDDFTLFGQIVILVLIQLGGLGIMIFGGVFGVLLGRQITLRESAVLQDAVSKGTIGHISSLVKFICVATFLLEAVGAVSMYSMWEPELAEPSTRWFYSIFHSVSAFCNAGFALRTDSLIGYRTRWQVYGVFMPLIVIGGLGFPAIHDICVVSANRFRYWWARRRHDPTHSRRPARPQRMRLSLHSRIVLAGSAMLIVGGAGLLYLAETPTFFSTRHAPPAEGARLNLRSEESMVGMEPVERAAGALFQSVTARTAGFNTVRTDPESMSPGSHFILCVLMFIGGSPASTAGGVKTVAMAVLLLAVVAALRRRQNVEAFSRTIPPAILIRAAVLVIGLFSLVTLVTLVLALTENATLREVLFESVSACGTVGLTTGLTPRLTGAGKVMIMLAMVAGRLGPLTLLIAVAGRTQPVRYEYPQEHVVIG